MNFVSIIILNVINKIVTMYFRYLLIIVAIRTSYENSDIKQLIFLAHRQKNNH